MRSATRMTVLLAWLAVMSLAVSGAGAATPKVDEDDFSRWLVAFGAEAEQAGISRATLDRAFEGVRPIARVIELDRSQPKKPAEFCAYLERRLSSKRIARGTRMLTEHAALLDEINREYGVPARYVVALWGLESNFGDYQGDYSVIASLATLAHEGRRAKLFRAQLLAALRIVEAGHQTADGMKGSWAGAMGQIQFMPTTFIDYAVDHDGDGRKDIWSNLADSLASAANYLRRAGWRSGQTWGREVKLPPQLRNATDLEKRRSVDEWQERGVRRRDGGDLPTASMHGSIVLPMRGPDPAFLVYRNYRTFLAWNQSTFFAISVGGLANEISGGGSLHACRDQARSAGSSPNAF